MEAYKTHEIEGLTVKIIPDSDPINWRKEGEPMGHMVCFHRRYNLGDEHNFSDPEQLFIALLETCPLSNEDVDGIILASFNDEYGREEYKEWMQSYRMEGESFKEMRREYVLNNLEELFGMQEARLRMNDVILDHYTILPLYLYDHSGITMNTGGFSCPWDSGQVGYIYVSHRKLMKEYGLPSMDVPYVAEGKVVASNLHEMGERVLEAEAKEYDQYLTGDVWGFEIEDEDGCHLDSCWGFYGLEYAEEEAMSAAKSIAKGLAGQDYSI